MEISKHGTKECPRCGEQIEKGAMVAPIPVPNAKWKRWAHSTCSFPSGYGLDESGERVLLSEIDICVDDGVEPEQYADEDASHEDTTSMTKFGESGDGNGGEVESDVADSDELDSGGGEGDSELGSGDDLEPSGGLSEKAMEEIAAFLESTLRDGIVPKLTAEVVDKVEDIIQSDLDDKFDKLNALLKEAVQSAVNEQLAEVPPKVIEIKYHDREDLLLDDEILHKKAEEVLELITASPRENVLLVGPSGSGKTHLHRQLGRILELRTGMVSCSAMMSEADFLGRLIPNLTTGDMKYQGTEFLDYFENGGIWLFDESDAADSNSLLVINSATSNGEMAVPNRRDNPVAKKHDDFICICAANTFGNGADRMYVGRNQQDAAWLDRFNIGTVEMDYDERIERTLCPDSELLTVFLGWREKIRDNRLRRMCSTRFIKSAYKMHTQKNWGMDKIQEKFFAGWTDDEKMKVGGAV